MDSVPTPLNQDLVSVGSLDVLVPRTRTSTFSIRSKRQHVWDEMNRSDRFLCLLTTLHPAQWQKLSKAPGLGLPDCTRDQRALFLSLIPQPFIYREYQEGSSGHWSAAPRRTLSNTDRDSVRIRLNI
ncbi:MAG: hypothetical protein V4671_21470, partial [Armatimonadota bacterium]